MRGRWITGLIVSCALMLLITCCKKDPTGALPDVNFLVAPVTGSTTSTFQITAEPVSDVPNGTTIFYRWDFDGDGVWDTPYSANSQVSKRFYQAGNKAITMEYADGKKQVKTAIVLLTVNQGYSAPHPAFSLNPVKGNYLTTFSFDASQTKDDEDSLDQLKFKWDFEGDGIWNTVLSGSPKASFKYKTTGIYYPALYVEDPTGRGTKLTSEVTVNSEDSLLIADFTLSQEQIQVNDTIILDASLSHHSLYPLHKMIYSWMLQGRVEWTDPNTFPKITWIPGRAEIATIKLKITDQETGLNNLVSKNITIGNENLPPKAKIQAGAVYGNILTQFYFDSWATTDDTQAPSDLDVRWDFNGDGNWDTPYSKEKIIIHQFDGPGEFNVILQAKDGEGLTSTDKKKIYVSENTNQTGYFKDNRDGQFYGTVKLGNQWWMSQNLNYVIPSKEAGGVYQWLCLNAQNQTEQSAWCDKVGKLYRIGACVENRIDAEYVEVCPLGWRLPAKEDWEQLFATIGGEQNIRELKYGGKADFNALNLGYIDFYFLFGPDNAFIPIDTIFRYQEMYQTAFFFSTSEPFDPNHARSDIWQWSVDKEGNAWTGYGPTTIYMPIRCIKKD